MSKKDKAYKLFSEGKRPSDPEVKALQLGGTTRYTYFGIWKAAGRPDHVPHIDRRRKGVLADGTINLEGGDAVGAYRGGGESTSTEPSGEVPIETSREILEPEPEEEKDIEHIIDSEMIPLRVEGSRRELDGDGHKTPMVIPQEVIGTGLRIGVTVALKTLSFYEIAHTLQPNLTLGDFIDQCVEDFFVGRGEDLGIIKIGVGGINGG